MLVFPKTAVQSFCCVLIISQIAADDGILKIHTVVTERPPLISTVVELADY